jgi:hypothetical protein
MSRKPYAVRLATGLLKPTQRVRGMDGSGVAEAVSLSERRRFRGSKIPTKCAYLFAANRQAIATSSA